MNQAKKEGVTLRPDQQQIFNSIVASTSKGIALVGKDKRSGSTTLSSCLIHHYISKRVPRVAVISGDPKGVNALVGLTTQAAKPSEYTQVHDTHVIKIGQSTIAYFSGHSQDCNYVKWGFYDVILVDDFLMNEFLVRNDLHQLAQSTPMVAFASVDRKDFDQNKPIKLPKEVLFYLRLERT